MPALMSALVRTPDEWPRRSLVGSWDGQDRATILPPRAGNGFSLQLSYVKSTYLYCILQCQSRTGFGAFSTTSQPIGCDFCLFRREAFPASGVIDCQAQLIHHNVG